MSRYVSTRLRVPAGSTLIVPSACLPNHRWTGAKWTASNCHSVSIDGVNSPSLDTTFRTTIACTEHNLPIEACFRRMTARLDEWSRRTVSLTSHASTCLIVRGATACRSHDVRAHHVLHAPVDGVPADQFDESVPIEPRANGVGDVRENRRRCLASNLGFRSPPASRAAVPRSPRPSCRRGRTSRMPGPASQTIA